MPAPTYSLPVFGGDNIYATKTAHDGEINRCLRELWNSAVFGTLGDAEKEELLATFLSYAERTEAAVDQIVNQSVVSYPNISAIESVSSALPVGYVLHAVKERVTFEISDASYPRATAGGQYLKPVADAKGCFNALQFGDLGTSDDSDTLIAMAAWGGLMEIPAGEYTVLQPIPFSVPGQVFAWGVTITSGEGFTTTSTDDWNKKAVILLNETNNTQIFGLEVKVETSDEAFGSVGFLLRNSNLVKLIGCKGGTGAAHVGAKHICWEIYGGCEHVEIAFGSFIQSADTDNGGNWVQAFGSDTKHIDIHHNYFQRTGGKDEMLAVYGVVNIASNVHIHDNYFKRFKGSVTEHNTQWATFSTSQEDKVNAGVRHIVWENNTLDVEGGATLHVASAGRTNTVDFTVNENIIYRNNVLILGGFVGGSGDVFECQVGAANCRVDGNTFKWKDTTQPKNLFKGAWASIEGNIGTVRVGTLFTAVDGVGPNKITAANADSRICEKSGRFFGGDYQAGLGPQYITGGVASGNGYEKTVWNNVTFKETGPATSPFWNSSSNGTTEKPGFEAIGCTIKCPTARSGAAMFNTSAWPQGASAESTLRLSSNVFEGLAPVGLYIGANGPVPFFRECRDNSWWGDPDDRADAKPSGNKWTMYPVGHEVKNNFTTVSGGTMLTHWMKDSSGVWRAITVDAA